MIATLRPLLMRMAVCVGAALAVVGVCALFGLHFSLPLPIALGVVGGALLWISHVGLPRADHLRAPALDLDADYALPHAPEDRKSTRLNSSHVATSYAVFCSTTPRNQVPAQYRDQVELHDDVE